MDPSAVPTLVGLVTAAAAAVVWQMIRRPVQRKLAVRDATRRPGEAALVIGGSLLGAALITGSFITGDTLDSSIKARAYTQLGPIDEMIVVPDRVDPQDVEQRIAALVDPRIDGVTTAVTAPASFLGEDGGPARAEPEAQIIELDWDEARAFGEDPAATGISGPPPAPDGEVYLTEDLAETLDVAVGDEVSGFVYGKTIRLEVGRVLPRLGVAGFWLGFESASANALVAPGTIESAISGKLPPGALPPTTSVFISNRGGVEEGGLLTDQVTAAVESALRGLPLRVATVKDDLLDAAEVQGDEFSELFLGIGAFAIIAGVLLLVNIFVMLADERKSQLGMLRAVGMRRGDLVRGFVIEGFFYALAAGVIGSLFGIFVGWAIVKLAAPIFSGFEEGSLELIFDANPASIIGGFCIGVLISMVTVFGTSLRISRVNIIRAIRDLPEPPRLLARTRTVVVGGVVAAFGLLWFLSSLGEDDAWFPALMGPVLAAFGLLPTLTRTLGRRTAVLVVSGFSLLWGIFGNQILGNQFFESGEIYAFVVQGVLLTFSAVIFLTQTQETMEGGLRRAAASRLSLRLGLAYPLAKRFRTGLTLGMFALVIFTMVFISVLANVFGGQVEAFVDRASGGYDIAVTASASNPPSADDLASLEGVERVAALHQGIALWQPRDEPEPEEWPLVGIDSTFVTGGPPHLADFDPSLGSQKDAWNQILRNPNAVIVPEFFLQTGGGPPAAIVKVGDEITIIDPVTNKVSRRTVAGIMSDDITFAGVFMSTESARAAVSRISPSRFFIATDGTESRGREIAAEIQGEFIANGAEADTFLALAEEFQQLNLQFLRLMEGYLALGLLVGIAGLGVLMVRAVRERRRDIGVLRSLGFVAQQIRTAFLLESGFVALEGILVGAALALVTASQLVRTGEFGDGVVFIIPWGSLWPLCSAALIASLAATAWPARQASRVPPAVALRVAD